MLLPDTNIVSDDPEQKTTDRVGITTKNIRRYGSVRLNYQLVILYNIFVKYGYLARSGAGS